MSKQHAICVKLLQQGTIAQMGFNPQSGAFFLVHENGTVRGPVSEFKGLVPDPDVEKLAAQNIVRLPSECADHGNAEKIRQEVQEFIRAYVDLPPFWESFSGHYILSTWCFERLSAIPFFRILRPPGTGKTTLGKVMSLVCMNCATVSGSISAAGLFRTADILDPGTMVIDECDQHGHENRDFETVLRSGYERDVPVQRCNKDNNFRPEFFRVFGPKVVTAREQFSDDSLESRCLTFQPTKHRVRRDVPLHFPDVGYEKAQVLRNKLLDWRFRNYFNISVNENELRNLSEPRLAQIAMPVFSTIKDPDYRREFLEFLGNSGKERIASTEEALLVSVLSGIASGINGEAKEVQVKQIADVAEKKGPEFGFREKYFTPKRVGGILRSLDMPGEKRRAGIFVEVTSQKVRELKEQFPMSEKETPDD